MPTPSTLYRTVSPPPIRRNQPKLDHSPPPTPRPADIEAGEAHVGDPFLYWTEHLEQSVAKRRRRDADASSPSGQDGSQPLREVMELYQRHENNGGHLFVVHQHNHPIAGVHYDLRLQFSKDSALSFSVPYGLPGNPNSRRRGRLAVETRVHCLWNHLVESASPASGSLLIWDFGTYTVLPRKSTLEKQRQHDGQSTSESESEPEFPPLPSASTVIPPHKSNPAGAAASEPAKLRAAFQDRSLRLRLNGLRLPDGYTITLRLSNPTPPVAPRPARDPAPLPPRKRKRPRRQMYTPSRSPSPSPSPSTALAQPDSKGIGSGTGKQAAVDESVQIRAQNAYPGSTNDIGSVHQRQWFLTLDKEGSGFVKRSTETGVEWVKGEGEGKGFDEFFVMGAEVERSIVTGRTSEELFEDEGVKSFRARKSWRPVLE